MNKPIIAIDCDDVIFESAAKIIEHYNTAYDANIDFESYYSKDETLWGTDINSASVRVQSFLCSPEYQQSIPLPGAIEAIGELASKYELHIVTARSDSTIATTNQMLHKFFPDAFKSIIFTNHFSDKSRTKADVCNELGATYLIDDHIHHAEIAAKQGVQVLLFGKYPWNEAENLPNSVCRVNDWHNVREILLK